MQEDTLQALAEKLNVAKSLFRNQEWRLNNLYKIKDKQGKVVDFLLNDAQAKVYQNQWYLNIILKARQLGFTTLIDILILDTCLFNANVRAGIIAHNREDAKAFFEEKIAFPYDNLDPLLKDLITATTDRSGEIAFNNGSKISVSTSFRSGTLQILHVSEYGKIAAKYPDKSKEIRTGAFEAVAMGQKIFIESTAEGREGDFYDMCQRSQKFDQEARTHSKLDFKFHFFPWHENPEYRLEPEGIIFTTVHIKYFKDLMLRGIPLDKEQMSWWIKKYETLGNDIYREHPSYPEEAFKASVEGAYYGQVMAEMRNAGRIGRVPWEPSFPVHTMWDLGMDDSTSIVFFQQIVREIRFIRYVEGSGEGLPYYANQLDKTGYKFGNHYLPHDVRVRELGTGIKRIDTLRNLGVRPIIEVPRPKNKEEISNQIAEVRTMLRQTWIDDEHCDQLIKCLDGYRHEWDDKLGAFKDTALHNWASHGADSVRTGAVGFKTVQLRGTTDLEPELTADY